MGVGIVPGTKPEALVAKQISDHVDQSLLARFSESVRNAFTYLQEFFSRAWGAIVIGVTDAGSAINFTFFRIVTWWSPETGSRLEVVYLRIVNFFKGVQDAWNEGKAQKEKEQLEDTIQTLKGERDLLQLKLDNEQKARLSSSKREELAQQEVQLLKTQIEAQGRLLTLQQVSSAELAALRQKVVDAEAERDKALAAAPVSADDLRAALEAELKETEDLNEKLKNLVTVAESIQAPSDGEETEVDDLLGNVLPSILNRIQTVQARLQPEDTDSFSRKGSLEALGRSLNQLQRYASRIVEGMHSARQSNRLVGQKMFHQASSCKGEVAAWQ
jgi:hypothetical protein